MIQSISIIATLFSLLISFILEGRHIKFPEPNRSTEFEPSNQIIDRAALMLRNGDLLVRMNNDPASSYIRMFNRKDKSYSHSGIVIIENGHPFVYHMVSGDENPGGKMKRDSLFHFCNPKTNLGFAIYRYNMKATEIELLNKVMHEWYREGIRFDSTFNLQTDDRMYCSEMVRKAVEKATAKKIQIATTKVTREEAYLMSAHLKLSYSYTAKLKLISIDNLYINAQCNLIRRYNYQQKHFIN